MAAGSRLWGWGLHGIERWGLATGLVRGAWLLGASYGVGDSSAWVLWFGRGAGVSVVLVLGSSYGAGFGKEGGLESQRYGVAIGSSHGDGVPMVWLLQSSCRAGVPRVWVLWSGCGAGAPRHGCRCQPRGWDPVGRVPQGRWAGVQVALRGVTLKQTPQLGQ